MFHLRGIDGQLILGQDTSPTKTGYAHVSTHDQQLHLQAASCADIVQEKASSSKDRPQLQWLLTRLRPGDTLVVWILDRLGRSFKDLVTLVTGFQEKEVYFVSLHDHRPGPAHV